MPINIEKLFSATLKGYNFVWRTLWEKYSLQQSIYEKNAFWLKPYFECISLRSTILCWIKSIFWNKVWFYESLKLSFYISKQYFYLFLKDGIFTIIEILLHYRFPFSFCWNGFLVATVLLDNILFFAIIKFIIIRKIPSRWRNDSRILKIEIDGEEALSYGNL